MQKTLHLFDFDGTITNKDSLFEFLKFCNPEAYQSKYLIFIPQFALAKFGILKKGKVKEQFIKSVFKGFTKSELEDKAQSFFEQQNIIRPKAKEKLEELKLSESDDVYMVSASLDLWLNPFANHWNMNLICTKSNYKNDRFIGFDGENCNYEQKKIRIQKEIDLKKYENIIAYGDTNGDKEMFSLADESNFQVFN